jgi:hypothetical protein
MSEAVQNIEPFDPTQEPDSLAVPDESLESALPALPDGETGLDDTSGMSEEDAREVLADIEKVVTANRITVDDEVFAVSPAKRGVVFPVIVNVFLLLVLSGGIATFAVLFRMEERSITQSVGGFSSAEGRLIEELKRESEEQLQQKNREIEEIQTRLADIQQERRALEEDITQRISQREQQLRLDLQAELAAERARLQSQGVSEAVIAERLRQLEAEKTRAYEAQLASFRAQAEDERRRIEENLQALQAEFNDSLQNLSREREELLAESQARERELRAQLESRTQALEEEKSSIEEQLEELSEQREREEIVEQQLIGFYDTVKDEFNAGDYQQAVRTLGTIRDYLNEDGIADLPAMLQRREVEFFVLDSLASLVDAQQGRTGVDVGSVVAQADLITRLRERATAAQTAQNTGDLAEAERLYRETLAIIPEVQQGVAFLQQRSSGAEADRRSRLDAALAQAEAAFASGNYQTALQRYRGALEYLPRTPEQVGRTLDNIAQSGYQLGALADRAGDASASAEPLARAQGLLEEGLYYDAVLAFVDVLDRYPQSPQAEQAVAGVNAAVSAQREIIERGASSLQDRIAGLEISLQERLQEIEELEASLAQAQQELEDREESLAAAEMQLLQLQAELQELKGTTIPELNARIASFEDGQGSISQLSAQERDALVAERDELAATIDTLNEEIGALRQEVAVLREDDAGRRVSPEAATDEEIRQEMSRLLEIERTFEELRQGYRRYAQTENRVLAAQGEAGLLETKLHLDDFLTSDVMEQSFPGLWSRIKKYDQAFEDVGRRVAVQDLTDTVYELSLYDNDAERIQYLEQQILANEGNEPMIELLEEIKDLLQL